VAEQYILTADDEVERRRLELLQLHHDPDSITALERTGVGSGWRCLDVGAGAGSISRWLVARGADVLATDLDIAGLDGLNARMHDITGDEPLPGPFDLVHTRLVLLHLPSREAVARRLVELTRPGGWVVAGDIDFTPVAMDGPTPAWDAVWAAWCAATEAAGWDLGCGPRLAELLQGAGLTDIEAAGSGGPVAGGAIVVEILSLAFERLRERLVAHGASDDQIADARASLMDPAQRFVPPVTWTVSGRRPE
jgi:SAM-dependent methyltransferase